MTAAAVAAIDVVLLWPLAASASAPTAVGGWRIERQGTPALSVPTSPVTDDGTLAVRNGPAGVLAFVALRYDAAAGTLALEMTGQPPPTVPAIDACRITSSWKTGADQTWDTRPTYDCSHHVVANVSGTQLSWDLDPAFAAEGTLEVALVPDAADPTPFAVSVAMPTSTSFQPAETDNAGDGALPPPVAPPATSAPLPAPAEVSVTGGEAPRSVVAPLVASPASSSAPQVAAAPVAEMREPGSRTAGAAALAAFALIVLVRSFMSGGPRGHAPRSLLIVKREGS